MTTDKYLLVRVNPDMRVEDIQRFIEYANKNGELLTDDDEPDSEHILHVEWIGWK